MSTTDNTLAQTSASRSTGSRTKKMRTRMCILVRRIHLYAGLFLLPWVFLYGITGAMFNHQGLFPEVEMAYAKPEDVAQALHDFPKEEELAAKVVQALQSSAPDTDIQLRQDHRAEFNNPIILQVPGDDENQVILMDPSHKTAYVNVFQNNPEVPDKLIPDIQSVKLPNDPYELAKEAAPKVLESAGLASQGEIKPLGWCKLNFLAEVDGGTARVTYVLRDGHVDIEAWSGQDGMTPRQFFLRLHTTHGQPPNWNGRMYWSILVDVMAIAMVSWGVTGLIMWWSIKRTRWIGCLVILFSVGTACWLYFQLSDFYAITKL